MVEEYISRKDAEDAVRSCCLEASACNLQCIKDIPAVDVRPVKRGHWTLQYDGDGLWRCSECGSKYIHTSNFCSHCGADMRPEPPEEE